MAKRQPDQAAVARSNARVISMMVNRESAQLSQAFRRLSSEPGRKK